MIICKKLKDFVHAGAWFRDMKHGEGKYTYANNDIYKGEWKNDIRHGTGTYFFAMSMSQVCSSPNAFPCLLYTASSYHR